MRRQARPITVLLALLLFLLPRPATASELSFPIDLNHDGVIVRAQAGMSSLAQRISNMIPARLKAISTDLRGLRQPPKIEIRLIKRTADMNKASPPGYRVPKWAAGVAFPRAGIVIVATRRGHNSINVANVVTHELAHLALGAALRGRAPRWLDEGFAYLHSSEWSIARWRTLVGMAWTDNAIPWRELDASFPAQEHEAGRAYAQSYDFVAYLANRGIHKHTADDGDRWPFQRFLALIAKGHTPDEAARVAYLSSMDELHTEWYQRLKQRYMILPAGLFALGIWVFGAFLLILAYLRRRQLNRRRLLQWAEEEADLNSTTSPQNV